MKYDEALELFHRAIQFSPENALVRYHRAKILIALKRYTVSVGVLPSGLLGRSGLIDTRCGACAGLDFISIFGAGGTFLRC